GRKPEHQWTEQGSRPAGKTENGAVARPVGDEGPGEADQRRGIEKKTVDDDPIMWTSGQPHIGFRRPKAEEKNRHPVRNIVPVECPYVLDRDRIGKHRAVRIELELVNRRDDDKSERPAEAA